MKTCSNGRQSKNALARIVFERKGQIMVEHERRKRLYRLQSGGSAVISEPPPDLFQTVQTGWLNRWSRRNMKAICERVTYRPRGRETPHMPWAYRYTIRGSLTKFNSTRKHFNSIWKSSIQFNCQSKVNRSPADRLGQCRGFNTTGLSFQQKHYNRPQSALPRVAGLPPNCWVCRPGSFPSVRTAPRWDGIGFLPKGKEGA